MSYRPQEHYQRYPENAELNRDSIGHPFHLRLECVAGCLPLGLIKTPSLIIELSSQGRDFRLQLSDL